MIFTTETIFKNTRRVINNMIKAIVFDLDGTLLNTLIDLTDSMNVVLENHGMKKRTVEEVRTFVGNGIPMLVKRAVEDSTDEQLLSICTKEMIDYYKTHNKIKTAPYEGIPDLLDELNDMKIALAVVTNKEESAAIALCREIFGDKFKAVIGDDGKNALKPAPDNVFRALEILGSKKEETLYIGDSEVDMKTAKNSGLKSVGVLWGFRSKSVLEENGADFIVSQPYEIKGLIK